MTTKKNKWYQLSIKEIFQLLETDEHGLNREKVRRYREHYGLNALPKAKPPTYVKIFFDQFKSPLIYILLIAVLIVLFLQEYLDAGVIFFVILFNSILGAYQEGKAQNALLALDKFITAEAVAIRDREEVIISDKELVPGDIIIIQDGDKIPADARLISSNNFQVNEAALTGESTPVLKKPETINEKTPVTGRSNMVYKGSVVISGNAKAVVVETGTSTFVGRISTQLSSVYSEMPLKKNIKDLSYLIIGLVFLASGILLIVGSIQGFSVSEMFTTVVAIAVSAIPEGLPVVITLVLASGVWRMSKRQALVKKLQAVEALGQAEIIAVDKTGTLTKNELMVQNVYSAGSLFQVSGTGYSSQGDIYSQDHDPVAPPNHPELILAAKAATYTATARVSFSVKDNIWKISGDPTEAALLVFGEKAGIKKEDLEAENPKIFEIPFNLELKYHLSVNKTEKGNFLSIVGAPEVILDLAQYEQTKDEIRPLTEENRKAVSDIFNKYTAKGQRVVAFAFNSNAPDNLSENDLPDLTFGGFFAMSDVIREEVPEALRRSQEANIKVVMITGDHKITATALAEQAGIYRSEDDILTGSEIDDMTTEELSAMINRVVVFARVTPEHKLKIIEAYKGQGKVVAMTGDGVNDALSLVAADLGVAMGKIGTEVAKEASDIVLLDDNFGSIVSAIEEGRNIYLKIKRVIVYLFSTNVSEITLISVALLWVLPIPLLPSQIIWLNMVTDGFLVAALALDQNESDILTRKFNKPGRFFIDKKMAWRIFYLGMISAIGSFILYVMFIEEGADKARTVTLTSIAAYEWFMAWTLRSETRWFLAKEAFSNYYLIGATVLVIGLQFLAVYHPFFQTILQTTPLTVNDWVMILMFASTLLIIEESRKVILNLRSKNTYSS